MNNKEEATQIDKGSINFAKQTLELALRSIQMEERNEPEEGMPFIAVSLPICKLYTDVIHETFDYLHTIEGQAFTGHELGLILVKNLREAAEQIDSKLQENIAKMQ